MIAANHDERLPELKRRLGFYKLSFVLEEGNARKYAMTAGEIEAFKQRALRAGDKYRRWLRQYQASSMTGKKGKEMSRLTTIQEIAKRITPPSRDEALDILGKMILKDPFLPDRAVVDLYAYLLNEQPTWVTSPEEWVAMVARHADTPKRPAFKYLCVRNGKLMATDGFRAHIVSNSFLSDGFYDWNLVPQKTDIDYPDVLDLLMPRLENTKKHEIFLNSLEIQEIANSLFLAKINDNPYKVFVNWLYLLDAANGKESLTLLHAAANEPVVFEGPFPKSHILIMPVMIKE